MSYRHYLRAFFVWLPLLALSAAWGQDSSPQAAGGAATDSGPQQPVPAYGQENSVSSIAENPPISGLDMPNLEPHAAPLSYLQAGAHLSEAVSSKFKILWVARASPPSQMVWAVWSCNGCGAITIWPSSYLGGVGYYDVTGIGLKQIEELGHRPENYLEER